MNYLDMLYNVNEIIVECGLEKGYINFSRDLNSYLLNKYGEYYLGLQLYQSDKDPTLFHVVASYKNKCGLNRITPTIQEDISNIYDCVWGNSVIRNSIFSYSSSTRVIPRLY